MFRLHCTNKDKWNRDIPEIDFRSMNEMLNYIDILTDSGINNETVFLFTWEEETDFNEVSPEIIISHNSDNLLIQLESLMFNFLLEKQTQVGAAGYLAEDKVWNFFLQEYYSYEEAYKVALSMRENLSFCYELPF